MSLYADDAALFIAPTAADIATARDILSLFGMASGLRANVQKSLFLPIACESIDLCSLLHSFPVPLGQFPCKYLGLPLHFKKITRADIQPTLDKMAARLQIWRGRLMAPDARLSLVNSVLSAIPIHLLTIFKLDSWVIKQMDKLRRNFLWRSRPNSSKGLPLVNWSTVCRPKHLGGLGILDIRRFSRALRLRWKWYDWTDKARPWAGSELSCDEEDLALFSACTTISLGNGLKASFWHDRWLEGQAPRTLAPDIFRLCYHKRISVHDAVENDKWLLGLHRISQQAELTQFLSLWHQVQQVTLSAGTEDSISWLWNDSKRYSAASAYQCQFAGSFTNLHFDKLWSAKVEPKCQFFMWLWLRGRILTNDNLATRGIPQSEMCNLCDQQDETPLHLILRCPFARAVWFLVAADLNFPAFVTAAQQAGSITSWWEDFACSLGKRKKTAAIYTAWNIWKERNRRVFDQKVLQESAILQLIRQDILQPALSVHWLSDVENSPEPEPD